MNEVLDAIRDRRSIRKFRSAPVDDEKIKAVLSAGQWAPSFMNLQPWKFVVIRDDAVKGRLREILMLPFMATDYRRTTAYDFLAEVPVIIVVCVDTERDELHYVEDGATATQNMALAAHSLGLASYWIGVFNHGDIEDAIREALEIPDHFRIISLLPIGVPDEHPTRTRNDLESVVWYEKFGGVRFSKAERN